MDALAEEYGWEKYGESYVFKDRDVDLIIDDDFKVYIDYVGRILTIKKILSNAEKKQIIKLFGER